MISCNSEIKLVITAFQLLMIFIFIARQQRDMLTRDIDIANLSVCP